MFLLFSLLWQCSTAMASSCSSDRNQDDRPRVSCADQGLSSVPDGIDSSTQVLVLSQNLFTSLTWSAYSGFPNLHELDLSQNHISVIEQSGAVLGNLKVLRLSNNRLTGLGGRMFNSAPLLMEVYLDKNNIGVLHDTTFSDLQQLEIINLSHNKLPTLPPRLLERVSSTSLKHFDLEGNRVQHLPDDFFSSKPDLPYVYLSQNPWMCSCQVSYLQRYLDDQGHNVYKHTGPTSIINDPESVVCAGPEALKGLAIIDLQEEQYCSTNVSQHFPAGDADPQQHTPVTTPTAPTSHRETTGHFVTFKPSPPEPVLTSSVAAQTFSTISAPVTEAPTTTSILSSAAQTDIVSTMKEIPETRKPTSPPYSTLSTSEPTTARVTTSTHPYVLSHFWTTQRTWTHRRVWSEVWTDKGTKSWTLSWPATDRRRTMSSRAPSVVTSQTNSPLPVTSTLSPHIPVQPPLAKYVLERPVPWCWWLFAGVLPLCVLSGLCSCMLFLWLIITYLSLYRPHCRRTRHVAQHRGVTLQAFRHAVGGGEVTGEGRNVAERVAFLPPETIRETQAVFRSVLFIEKGEEEEVMSDGTSDRNGEDKTESNNVAKIELVAAGERSTEMTLQKERRETTDRKEVYRKTLYREISREEEIEGWREVVGSQGPVERRIGERGEERRNTRFSLILREEQGRETEDRKSGMEWLVGQWETGRGLMDGSWESLIRRIEGGASPAAVTQSDMTMAAEAPTP